MAAANAAHVAETTCSKIDRRLRDSAPESIATFTTWLDERLAEIRRKPPIVTVDAVLNYGDLPQPIGSNYQAIQRWIERAVALRRKAENLALEALDETQLDERFAALREELGPVPGANEAEARDPSLAGVLQRRLERRAKEMAQ